MCRLVFGRIHNGLLKDIRSLLVLLQAKSRYTGVGNSAAMARVSSEHLG